ncbi:MAG: Crp/Fnr family transcriptional regulator, partial [Terriglobia bacterium]
MKNAKVQPKNGFDFSASLKKTIRGKTMREYGRGEIILSQGNACNEVCYLQRGRVKLSVISNRGKEAVLAIVEAGQFFGEDCLMGRSFHLSSATALEPSCVIRFEKGLMWRLIQKEQGFSNAFTSHLLARIVRVEEDLLDHFFNNSEKRLARALLLLANLTDESKTASFVPKLTQEMLASIVGTTRSRINLFMK